MAITLTKTAADEVLKIMADKEIEENKHFLRVGVRGGGCSGYSYTLDITETKMDSDEVWEHHGVNVVCDSRSQLYLAGTEIDFKDEIMGRGFVFNNPNHTHCGCGSSFS